MQTQTIIHNSGELKISKKFLINIVIDIHNNVSDEKKSSNVNSQKRGEMEMKS